MLPSEPEGDVVTSPPAITPDTQTIKLAGQHVTLVPLTTSHFPDLYTNIGGPEHAHVWRYIPNGPFVDLASFTQAMVDLIENNVFFPFAILSSDKMHLSNANRTRAGKENETETAISVICLMNIVPSHLCLEIGCVLFAPTLQRTTAATEAVYLLMRWAFEVGGYQRVEWKANNLNEPSKRAALRLGFSFEGVFRKHMVIKGKRRDTAWFSCLDGEWFGEVKGVKGALEEWLGEGNFVNGKQVRRLEDLEREEMKRRLCTVGEAIH